jgi:hypothetical protein
LSGPNPGPAQRNQNPGNETQAGRNKIKAGGNKIQIRGNKIQMPVPSANPGVSIGYRRFLRHLTRDKRPARFGGVRQRRLTPFLKSRLNFPARQENVRFPEGRCWQRSARPSAICGLGPYRPHLIAENFDLQTQFARRRPRWAEARWNADSAPPTAMRKHWSFADASRNERRPSIPKSVVVTLAAFTFRRDIPVV